MLWSIGLWLIWLSLLCKFQALAEKEKEKEKNKIVNVVEETRVSIPTDSNSIENLWLSFSFSSKYNSFEDCSIFQVTTFEWPSFYKYLSYGSHSIERIW